MEKSGMKIRVGIDIGGTNVKIGLVNEAQELVAVTSIASRMERPWQEVARDIGESVLGLLKENHIAAEQCVGAGVGIPGLTEQKSGRVIYSNNLGWENVPLAEELSKYLAMPIRTANDADCAVLGEAAAGAAKGCDNVIMLTLGTGVGGGIVLNGRLFQGALIGGVEPGHMVIEDGGEQCTCGRKGCLEAYASATALIRDGRRAMEADAESLLWEECEHTPEKLNPLLIFNAAKKGDRSALLVVENYREKLVCGIASLVNIFRPEIVLIGGGVSKQGDYLFGPINEELQKQCFGGAMGEIPKVMEAVLGNDAGMIGAANL